ncbi:hypothetical protein HTY54_11415 [Escherichia coli]|nr:hypothetical protein [Escherichia coli]
MGAGGSTSAATTGAGPPAVYGLLTDFHRISGRPDNAARADTLMRNLAQQKPNDPEQVYAYGLYLSGHDQGQSGAGAYQQPAARAVEQQYSGAG